VTNDWHAASLKIACGEAHFNLHIVNYVEVGSRSVWGNSILVINAFSFFRITHILNVTLEVDNFFPDDFIYKNIRLYDIESSDLLPHWNNTWKFINEARKSSGKCLVHCKMGISRSGATVVAYLMKEMQWQKSESLEFVKECRSIVHPNPSFLRQLDEYGGILSARLVCQLRSGGISAALTVMRSKIFEVLKGFFKRAMRIL